MSSEITEVGKSLCDSLIELQDKGKSDENFNKYVLNQFDKTIISELSSNYSKNPSTSLNGNLYSYNQCDDVWKMSLKNVKIESDSEEIVCKDLIMYCLNENMIKPKPV